MRMIDIQGADQLITPQVALRLNHQRCKEVTAHRLLIPVAMRESRNLGPSKKAIRNCLYEYTVVRAYYGVFQLSKCRLLY
mmetsp:Transcript_25901/g.46804  ORF Transcript_25901/g.46804 Transcript_25901/m.46804 type:complete len:80 (+) Transcript_25901:451-690(+)